MKLRWDDEKIYQLKAYPKIDTYLAWKSAFYTCGLLQDSKTSSSDYQKNPWWVMGWRSDL
jgi:hypothetical protein